MVYIVGLGPGHKDYILPKAIETLKNSNEVIGFSRAIESLDLVDVEKKSVDSLRGILEIINSKDHEKTISIVASGDPTFYGIAEYVKNNYLGELEVIPGISSFQYLTCKMGKSWSKAYAGSLHGREDDFIKKVNEYNLSIWLTDNKNNPSYLCEKLIENKVNCKVIVGENLSYKEERIIEDFPGNVVGTEFTNLSVFIVEKIKEEIK